MNLTYKERAHQEAKSFVDLYCLIMSDTADMITIDIQDHRQSIHHQWQGALLETTSIKQFVEILETVNLILQIIGMRIYRL